MDARDRLLAVLAWLFERRWTVRSERWQRILLLFVAAIFLSGACFAYRALPATDYPVRWILLAAAGLIGVPIMVALNGARYDVSARILGHRVPLVNALRISIASTVANLLPIPGAVLERVQGIRRLDLGFEPAFQSTGVIAAAWIGVTGVLAGALQFYAQLWVLGAVLLGSGALCLLVADTMLRVKAPPNRFLALAGRILVIEAAVVVVNIVRLYLVRRGIGIDVTVLQAFVLTVASALATAAVFSRAASAFASCWPRPSAR
ncbi:MAG: hypothetical protein O7G83_20640 [Proteobacteria bacterium]|nr:hypothetical protein [Pseudomonadota bacterium]